ncbi:LIM domain-binding protein 3-like isoform X1 [Polyodon spathula]|uniref:LIM domain-binding protein 3-like isoform X1 n=1 Tax=Polyodon spathula TaxID=7913 RepID=UPI001B7F1DE9|nr:LIM domain-binding protein 3-like isoform X1 [Polyodon spathula]
MSSYKVTLSGSAPWGFRLQGGKDFNMPLTISRITPGSKAAMANLTQGDIIVGIDGVSTDGMTHLDAQNKIKCASYNLALTMQKSKRPAPVPTATPRMDSPMSVIPHQKILQINGSPSACNTTSGQLGAPNETNSFIYSKQETGQSRSVALTKGGTPSPSKRQSWSAPGSPACKPASGQRGQYNNPIGLYSAESIKEMTEAHSSFKGRISGVPWRMLPVKDPLIDSASPVYQAVIQNQGTGENQEIEEWSRRAANLQSKSFRILAHITGTEYMQDPDVDALRRSREKFETEVKGPRFAKLKNWHNGLSAQILNV